MAASSFKSASKRGSYASSSRTISTSKDRPTEDSRKKIPNQRSRSVSAVPRSFIKPPPASSVLSEFSNTRDNPLFGCSSSSSPDSEGRVGASKGGSDVSGSRRGRSVSRSSGLGAPGLDSRSESGRSLSRIGTGRRLRSLSRGHRGNSESEVEHGHGSSSSLRKKETISFSSNGELPEQVRNLQTWTSRHPISETWDTSSVDHSSADSGTDGIYETVRSEVRRAVSEIRNDLENAILIKNPAVITTENIADIPPELVNTDAIELVSDIRREYALKFEQSQERARKLRADLAVEEQRGQELIRILKEIVPDPKSSETRRSRPRRKASIERLRMSRRLAEEAMNYFDECVSISTFDSSDFSSIEDPQPSSVIPPMGSSRFSCNDGLTLSVSHFPDNQPDCHEESDNQTQCSLSIMGSDLAISSCSGIKADSLFHENNNHGDLVDFDTLRGRNAQYSFAHEPTETGGIHDIRCYIKKFKKDPKESQDHAKVKSSYGADDNDLISSEESFLFNKLPVKSGMEPAQQDPKVVHMEATETIDQVAPNECTPEIQWIFDIDHDYFNVYPPVDITIDDDQHDILNDLSFEENIEHLFEGFETLGDNKSGSDNSGTSQGA
ncbi:hypothetical protein COCNU_04G005590 [Cocos nucifera]|uniref:Uncharacterized protein n=1 Tax=Cocos nucifera TaxID=13894 RepID=A0A8K0N025_COCNU|nr:hypothetical protein COCNU_04G005590 [Cocos nucifera]